VNRLQLPPARGPPTNVVVLPDSITLGRPSRLGDAGEEIFTVIDALHAAEQRLEDLTGGEVDSVAGRDGKMFLVRRAQEQFRHTQAAKQAAILNALPAHVAMIDARGIIVSVNDAWRRFASENAEGVAGDRVGLDYLNACDAMVGHGPSEFHPVAGGIRSVLDGSAKSYSFEYSLHSLTQRRWFLMTVAPLEYDRLVGAVVMHMDVTAERLSQEGLRASEQRFLQMAENIRDVFFLIDAASGRMLYVSPAYEEIWGLTTESVYARSESWIEAVHPDDRAYAQEAFSIGLASGSLNLEYRIVRPDGAIRWIQGKGFPVYDSAGKYVRVTGTASDITDRRRAQDALQALSQKTERRERILSTTLASITDFAYIYDREGRFLFANQPLLDLLGITLEEVVGKNFFDLGYPPDLAERLQRQLKEVLSTGKTVRDETPYTDPAGSPGYYEYIFSPVVAADGNIEFVVGTTRDISERKRAGIKIKHLNRVYAVLSGINALIVRARNRDELFEEACKIAITDGGFRIAMMGILDSDATKIQPVALSCADEHILDAVKDILARSRGALTPMVARAIAERGVVVSNDSQSDPEVSSSNRHAEFGVRSMAVLPLIVASEVVGAVALYSSEVDFFHSEEIQLLTELAGDIAFAIDHIDKQDRLHYLAYHDDLTALANRVLFLERVSQYIGGAAVGTPKLAVALIDIERFKNINDSLGQAGGDSLLKQVATWLTQDMGDESLIARIGADQFAIVLPEVYDEDNIARFVEKTLESFLDHHFLINEAAFRITFKAGVAVFPDDGTDANTLLKNAESALKKAKSSGDRYLFYKHKMTQAVAGRLKLENQLRSALDKQEFVLHYQPKVSLTTEGITGVEALIRWNDPRTGLVPPSQFIPVMEEIGLIHEVGRWALHKAMEDYLRWRDAGLPAVRIAVNVSPLQLRSRGFLAEVNQTVDIDPRCADGLELEITESLIMEDVKHSITVLQAIREMGVRVAIDDFGTGFSSLSYLSKLPVNTLKIDRSFVIDMTLGPQGLALVSTIVNLAHSLKLDVVAEGVETEEQKRLLHLLNCEQMQGYLFSKPLPADVFEFRYLRSSTNSASQ
jgi:diguanylate cyclase (GGDEF)-like protein/PAS domain S-box-containing protein